MAHKVPSQINAASTSVTKLQSDDGDSVLLELFTIVLKYASTIWSLWRI